MAAVAAPAFAQGASEPAVTGYGNLGYSLVDTNGPSLSAVHGGLGARFQRYFGLEGEVAFGLGSKTYSGADVHVQSAVGAYAVGFLPVRPNFDVFARVGYGHDALKVSSGGVSAVGGEDTVNYGGGVQGFITPKDGIRAEYTYHDLRHGAGHVNVWQLSYVRKFP
jgi:hypothetical protein